MNSTQPQPPSVSFPPAQLAQPCQFTHSVLQKQDSLNSPLQTISIHSQLLPEHLQQRTSAQHSQLNPALCSQVRQYEQGIISATSKPNLEHRDQTQQQKGQELGPSQKQTNQKAEQFIEERSEGQQLKQGEKENKDAAGGESQPQNKPEETIEALPQGHRDETLAEESLVEHHYQQIPVEELEEDQVITSELSKQQANKEHYFYGVEYQKSGQGQTAIQQYSQQQQLQQLPIQTRQTHQHTTSIRTEADQAQNAQISHSLAISKDNPAYKQQTQELAQQCELHSHKVQTLMTHENCKVLVQPQPGSQLRQQIILDTINIRHENQQKQVVSNVIEPQSTDAASIRPQKPQQPFTASVNIETKAKQENRQGAKEIKQQQAVSPAQDQPLQKQIGTESKPKLEGLGENRPKERANTVKDARQFPTELKQQQSESTVQATQIETAVSTNHIPHHQHLVGEIPITKQPNHPEVQPLQTRDPDNKSISTLNSTAHPSLAIQQSNEMKSIPDKAQGKKKMKPKKDKKIQLQQQKERKNSKPTHIQTNNNENQNLRAHPHYRKDDNNSNNERQQDIATIKPQPKTQDELNSSIAQSSTDAKREELPPLTSQVIENQAYKERMGSTYSIFLKYVSNYSKAIAFYKSIIDNVSFQINKRKNQRVNLLATLSEYFQGYAKLNQQFHSKTHTLQYGEPLGSSNPYGNIKFQLKNGYNALIELRRTVANEKNRISSFVLATAAKDIQKAFSVYFGKVSAEETKQAQRKAEHLTREKAFFKVISQVQKVFKKGVNGKFKVDILSQLARFVNDETTHRQFLKLYGKGVVPLRHTYIQAECELFTSLQQILNAFKTESKMLYSVGRRIYDHLEDLSRTVKDQTTFQQISPLTDIDYIRYVLELQEKKDHRVFKSHHFESYLDLIFFDKLVGNIRDIYKGAICKVFPMNLPHEELIHTVSGNLVHFNRETDQCLNVFVIKNINARIIGQCTVEFDQLLKGFIFNQNRTIRIKLKDNDRAQELICYLNEKDEDFAVEEGVPLAN